MIDSSVLKQLGWSDELIEATTRTAESMRDYPAANFPVADTSVQSIATSAVYSEAIIHNTVRELRVQEEKPDSKNS